MKPVIAIVGRANVGKSTLFNRLTRTRNALVADQPGVTRDRQYGIGEYNCHEFILIDTGGIGHNDNNSYTHLIAEQTIRAIEEAAAVIWMVDGRDGLTSEDENLANQLRIFSKKIYLAVNKSENLDDNIVTSEFYALGIGKPYAISALNKIGINEILDDITKDLPQYITDGKKDNITAKITVLGRQNVGKSTLINRILGESRVLTSDQPGTTRDSIEIPFDRDGNSYSLIDTAGVRRRSRVTDKIEKFSIVKTLQAIDDTEIVIMVIDAQEAITEQDASLLGLTVDSGKSLLIAINKWDGLDNAKRSLIRSQLDRKLGFIDYACIHYISALHGSGVGKMFESIKKISKSIKLKPTTSELTNYLQQATNAHPPPMVHGRRIKLRYAHLGGHNPLRVIIHGNQTKHVPDPYRRYLANTIRRNLNVTGVPVLIEFKRSDNPYKGRKNVLSRRKIQKRKRLIKHAKKNN